ncbi:two-component sensor histidine kinase [Desulfosarcina alkanivorans]|uniref:histidine kinase n=1 Tax=Desulfosarcina alkanivorans TaxID=571177 RepID=A0A5K7YUC5_9BACT|nr:PAS domain-containing sensor histidine kinase [Desulfosarcina alkanivorans]BBO72248.1 two-component sensor histidine kinase [Desulfosarcina alkanivorans]
MNPRDIERKNYYRPLRRNILLVVIFVSFIPLIVVSSGILLHMYTNYQEKVRVHLETLVKKHKQNIDHFLRERQNNISFLADVYSYEYLSDSTNLSALLQKLQSTYGYVFSDIGVVRADGGQVSYAGPFQLERAQYDDADWFQAAIRTDAYTSDVFKGLRGFTHFIVTARKEVDGQPWILRATVDFLAFNDVVENILIGQTGFARIINRVGALQTRTAGRPVPENHAYLELFRHPDRTGKGDIRFGTRKDEHGEDLIYVAGMLKNNQWALIFQQDKKDAFRDFYRTRNIIFLAFGLGGIAIATMATVLSGRMVNRIAAADREKVLMNKQIVESGHLASLGELAAGIAHEINNPVAIMVEEAGWIEDLLEEETSCESENRGEFKRALTQIRNQGIRARDITHKLLSFARRSDSRMDRVDVNDLIRDIVSLSAQQARYNNVEIKTSLLDSLPAVWASQTELQQVLINLINNAIDAIDRQGGIIEVKTWRPAYDRVHFSVQDNGPGIPEANLKRIFEPFFTTKPVGKGTGLGLSICYGIINTMGGDIVAESRVGDGTRFEVSLPVNAPKRSR